MMIEHTDFTHSAKNILSIRLSVDGFYFASNCKLSENTISTAHSVWVVDESLSMTANLRKAYNEISWLSQSFERVQVIIETERRTCVPLEFFEDEQMEVFFYHNFYELPNEQIHYNVLKSGNLVVLFGMDKSIINFLEQKYSQVKYYAHVSPCLEHFLAECSQNNHNSMYVQVSKHGIDVYAFGNDRLKICNHFECTETADKMFYVLYSWKQLAFDQEVDELTLIGNLSEENQLLKELRLYVARVSILANTPDFEIKQLLS